MRKKDRGEIFQMNRMIPLLIFLVPGLLMIPPVAALPADTSQIQELLDKVGLKAQGDKRGQMDTVGFVTTAEQMDKVFSQCNTLATPRQKALAAGQGWSDGATFIAGVCPHDDYYYAGRLYSLLLSRIEAKRVILFGVFHKARVFECRDRLVFDSYRTWHGPYGPVKVSPLREQIIERLSREDYVIDNDMQTVEHSVEAIVPFLQAYNRDVEIVSILVPYMQWETMDRLAADLSDALAYIINENGWVLGEDVCLISSADAIHYGDAGWGGSNFAEFGTDVSGYKMAVERDLKLAENHLCGPVERDRLKTFLYRCIDVNDVMKYQITWCGRFSIPFGLNVASRLMEAVEGKTLTGTLLDYGTSVSEVSLQVEGLDGLGATAPNNLRHFVGYVSIGYR
jgi:AmmeMemoRadiSam system protein B